MCGSFARARNGTRSRCQRVLARQSDHDRLAQHRLGRQIRLIDRERHESHVQAALADGPRLFRRPHVPYDHPDLRVPLREFPKDLDEDL